jgi:nucleoside-triphosphatase THEP1
MKVKPGIGKNKTLSENVFVTITCILNQIPLIITGNPGSSKTLAMNLILKSFKGPFSESPFFKRYPTLISYYYQGSEQSTSRGIEKTYKRAHEEQEKNDRTKKQIVVVFDEIGLAEIATSNPLKVLHSLLEPPRVATVGISNYSLDASKMNRAINLSRTEPSEEDLRQSAESIAEKSAPVLRSRYLANLAKWYMTYKRHQQKSEKWRNFHGLRDFYSLIKFISTRIKPENESEHENIIIQGIKRNFGGAIFEDVIRSLKECM